MVIQNKSMAKDIEGHSINFSEMSNKNFNPSDNEIAYYKPSDPGEDTFNSMNNNHKRQDHYKKENQRPNKITVPEYKKTHSNRNEYWDEDSFNIPTFLRKK